MLHVRVDDRGKVPYDFCTGTKPFNKLKTKMFNTMKGNTMDFPNKGIHLSFHGWILEKGITSGNYQSLRHRGVSLPNSSLLLFLSSILGNKDRERKQLLPPIPSSCYETCPSGKFKSAFRVYF